MVMDNNTIAYDFSAETFETKNRALEQFLYKRYIKPLNWTKDENNLTVWSYKVTPSVLELVDQYAKMQLFGTGWEAKR